MRECGRLQHHLAGGHVALPATLLVSLDRLLPECVGWVEAPRGDPPWHAGGTLGRGGGGGDYGRVAAL